MGTTRGFFCSPTPFYLDKNDHIFSFGTNKRFGNRYLKVCNWRNVYASKTPIWSSWKSRCPNGPETTRLRKSYNGWTEAWSTWANGQFASSTRTGRYDGTSCLCQKTYGRSPRSTNAGWWHQ